MKQGQRSAISTGGRGLENSRRRREFVVGGGGGGFWGILSQKSLKSRGSEMVFSVFNILNEIFLKEKLNLDKVLNKNIFPPQKSWVVLPATLQPNRASFALSVNRSFPKP